MHATMGCDVFKGARGHADIVRMLIEAGADLEVRHAEGGTALDVSLADDNLTALQVFAEAGVCDAQKALGERLLTGTQTRKDPARAALCFQKAALQGNADALATLGQMRFAGMGVAQDPMRALQELMTSAEMGSTHGFSGIQSYYAKSMSLPRDDPAVKAWMGEKRANIEQRRREAANEPSDARQRANAAMAAALVERMEQNGWWNRVAEPSRSGTALTLDEGMPPCPPRYHKTRRLLPLQWLTRQWPRC